MRKLELPVGTERLLLRAYRTDDLVALMSHYADPEVTRYLPWAPWTQQDAELAPTRRISRIAVDAPDSALGLVLERDAQVIRDVVLSPISMVTETNRSRQDAEDYETARRARPSAWAREDQNISGRGVKSTVARRGLSSPLD